MNNYISKIFMAIIVMCLYTVSNANAVDKKDRDNINRLLSLFGSDWAAGLDEMEKYFEVDIKKHVDDYSLTFILKSPPRIKYELYLEGKTGGLGEGRHEYPDGPECSASDLNQVDKIMKGEGSLWMLGSVDGILSRFDLSRGYSGLLVQDVFYYRPDKNNLKLRTRKYRNYAVLYYYDDSGGVYDPYTNVFSVWVDLKNEMISGAIWVELPIGDGGQLSLEDFRFIDKSLRNNGNFGTKGNVTEGLVSLMESNEVKLRLHSENSMWNISVSPESGDRDFISFDLSVTSGEVSRVISQKASYR